MILNWRTPQWPPILNGVELLSVYVRDANGTEPDSCWYLDTETGECRMDARNEWGQVIIDWETGLAVQEVIYLEPPFTIYWEGDGFPPFCLP
jgi:hypothetical protein